MRSYKRVCALGFFDGVHLGHSEIINSAVKLADELNAVPCVLTFDRKPKAFLSGTGEKLISPSCVRKKLVSSLFGDIEFLVLPFTETFSQMSAPEFVNSVLISQLGAAGVAAGRDYRFGKNAGGNVDYLKTVIRTELADTVFADGEKVSSTLVKKSLDSGSFEKAVRLLGHPFLLGGKVAHGDGRGRNIGFATLNLPMDSEQLYPGNGVYASFTQVDGNVFPSVTNLGNRPTFYDSGIFTNETHIIGEAPDLYGKEVWVWLCSYIRGERKFESHQELKRQVDIDISKALSVYEENAGLIRKIRRNFK